MAELNPHSSEEANVHRLYIRRHSRLSMELAPGDLKDAFVKMYREDMREKMGRQALIFYSDPQESLYRPSSQDHHDADVLDSSMTRRLAHLKSRVYSPTRWVDAACQEGIPKTFFRVNVLLDPQTQEQLHAGVKQGLSQLLFGRRAVTLALEIRDLDEIVESVDKRRQASHDIRDAIWADDAHLDRTEPNNLRVANGQKNKFTHIDWTYRTT